MTRLYSNLKFLRYPDRLKALADDIPAAPIHVRVKPINHCNHNCWYCAYRADQLQLGEDMDLEDQIPAAKMMELVDDFIAMGVEAVTFSGGGEPLIYKPIAEAVTRLAQAGIRVAALSNGANLKGKVADAFAEHGTWLRVSMDGWDDASYAESRGVKLGEFSRVIANLRAFAQRQSRCVLGVSFIVSQRNVGHIEDICRLLKDVGVNHVKISAAIVSNDVHENNLYHQAIMAEATQQIERAMTLASDGFAVLNHYHETEERFDKEYRSCPYVRLLTIVGADCNVYTCQDKAYNDAGKLGSIAERSFKSFWYSDEARTRMHAIDPSRHCRHHCISHEKNLAIMEILDIDPEHGRFV